MLFFGGLNLSFDFFQVDFYVFEVYVVLDGCDQYFVFDYGDQVFVVCFLFYFVIDLMGGDEVVVQVVLVFG